MVNSIVLQNSIFVRFILPFLLVFFIIFAILEKTKLLGSDKKQINAMVAFVIGLIVVAVAYPVLVISNLILFLTLAIITVFVGLLIWGFLMGEEGLKIFEKSSSGLKWTFGIVVFVAVIFAVLWATGFSSGITDFLFRNSWSGKFWINALFVVVIAVVLALTLKGSKSS